MYALIRSILFLLSPEKAHSFTLSSLHIALQLPVIKNLFITKSPESAATKAFGLKFPNKLGLAAGFDKNAAHISDLAKLGFGHIEVGTVTPLAQPGNAKPRLFRLPADHGLINRMGFNNNGVDAMVENLKRYYANIKPNDPKPIIGGNIGKNKVTPNEEAVSDYQKCYRKLYPYVDYFVINVSSPNTPNLRELQDKGPLLAIINALVDIRAELMGEEGRKPLLLKIAPDLTNEQLDDIVDIALNSELDGLIATNTTISRAGLKTSASTVENIGAGGLSGQPVAQRSTEVMSYLSKQLNGKKEIIGVGGIESAAQGQQKLDAGASLIQVYTGFIYGGPKLIKDLSNL